MYTRSFIINTQNHYLMIPRWKRRLGWGSPLRGGRRTHPPAGVVAAAMQPADISVAGEADDDACLPPTQRVPTPTRRKTYKKSPKNKFERPKNSKTKKNRKFKIYQSFGFKKNFEKISRMR